jgi:hypothetical protein
MVKQVDYCGKLKNKPAMKIHHEPKFAIWVVSKNGTPEEKVLFWIFNITKHIPASSLRRCALQRLNINVFAGSVAQNTRVLPA